MSEAGARWDERYRTGRHADQDEPAEIVRAALPLLRPPGPVLDVACGAGRNALFLARHGFRVLAVDISGAGLRRLAARSAPERLPLQPVQADVLHFEVRPACCGVVVNTYFLQRSLFPVLADALVPGGHLLVETYTVREIDELGGTMRREYALEREELGHAFPALETLFYEEGIVERRGRRRGLARLMARKPVAST